MVEDNIVLIPIPPNTSVPARLGTLNIVADAPLIPRIHSAVLTSVVVYNSAYTGPPWEVDLNSDSDHVRQVD